MGLSLMEDQIYGDYWCLETQFLCDIFFMFANTCLHVMSQRHDVTSTLIAIQFDSLCANCRFLKTGLADHIGVLQTPIRLCYTFWYFSLRDRSNIRNMPAFNWLLEVPVISVKQMKVDTRFDFFRRLTNVICSFVEMTQKYFWKLQNMLRITVMV